MDIMSQEAGKEINFGFLRAIVEEAIKNNDPSAIEAIKDEYRLRYMQKYTELRSSKRGLAISFESYLIGMDSVAFAIIGIGISYILVALSKYISMYSWSEIVYILIGLAIVCLGIVLLLKIKPKRKKEFEKAEKDIKFMHDIVMKIEEKLIEKEMQL